MSYTVLQGNYTSNGHGDLVALKTFNELQTAKDFFEKIKNDNSGYTRYPHGYIETWLVNDEVDCQSNDYVIDAAIFNYFN